MYGLEAAAVGEEVGVIQGVADADEEGIIEELYEEGIIVGLYAGNLEEEGDAHEEGTLEAVGLIWDSTKTKSRTNAMKKVKEFIPSIFRFIN